MHMYGISNSLAMFSPNLASLGRMGQEKLDKIGEIVKNTKVLLFKLVALYMVQNDNWGIMGHVNNRQQQNVIIETFYSGL